MLSRDCTQQKERKHCVSVGVTFKNILEQVLIVNFMYILSSST